MESLTSFEFIGITSFGRNYLLPADLVVIDGYTKKVLPEVDIRYEIGDTSVRFSITQLECITFHQESFQLKNSNGVGISSLSFDNTTKL